MNNHTDTPSSVPARFTDAVGRLDGDTLLLREMAAMTAPEFSGLVEQAKVAAYEGDCETSVRTLHKLKGMLSTFESDGIVLEIQEIIHAARSQKCELLKSLFRQHEAAILDLISDIRDFTKA